MLKRLAVAHGAVLARFGPRRERPVGWIDRMALTLRREELRATNRKALEKKLPEEFKAALRDLGHELPRLWESEVLKPRHKKGLLRCVIDKVVMARQPQADRVDLRIVWRGGLDTELSVGVDVGSMRVVRRIDEMEARFLELEAKGLSDEAIASALAAEGFRSPRCARVLPPPSESSASRRAARLGTRSLGRGRSTAT